ncbi:unnamed protein product [Durusdinium trenchii]|uniref:Transmembrane protein n=1 Tax=Durusdinium trenchii TaxID=1381693 RepID=A0ABP0M428_9DINO
MAALFLMFVLSSWRAGSVLDVFFQPAHLLRPKNYSRFGLGENQRSSRMFFSFSVAIRLGCAAMLGGLFLDFVFLFDFEGYYGCRANNYPWAEYDDIQLQSDLHVCSVESNPWCPAIRQFEHCHDPDLWSSQLRGRIWNDLGLECGTQRSQDVASIMQNVSFHGSHCMSLNGTQLECHTESSVLRPENLIVWTEQKSSLKVCGSWPQVHFSYECQMVLSDISYCQSSAGTPKTTWESVLFEFCEVHGRMTTLPEWLAVVLNDDEKFYVCQCQHCAPWYRSNGCVVEAVDMAMRRAGGRPQLNDLLAEDLWFASFMNDPIFCLQFALMAVAVFGPFWWLVFFSLFGCCLGNPLAVPADVELQEGVRTEELVLQAELASNGYIEAWCLNRLGIIVDLGFCVADFVVDIKMIVLYYQSYHYGFAVIQICLLLRFVLEQLLRRGLFHPIREAVHSLKANLRTDHVLSLVQSEKSGEATLAYMLRIYTLFYMGEQYSGYWTAFISLLISVRGLTQGCYIHFDLAFISSEDLPPIDDPATSVVPTTAEPDRSSSVDRTRLQTGRESKSFFKAPQSSSSHGLGVRGTIAGDRLHSVLAEVRKGDGDGENQGAEAVEGATAEGNRPTFEASTSFGPTQPSRDASACGQRTEGGREAVAEEPPLPKELERMADPEAPDGLPEELSVELPGEIHEDRPVGENPRAPPIVPTLFGAEQA